MQRSLKTLIVRRIGRGVIREALLIVRNVGPGPILLAKMVRQRRSLLKTRKARRSGGVTSEDLILARMARQRQHPTCILSEGGASATTCSSEFLGLK
jgi:hypothetical protein